MEDREGWKTKSEKSGALWRFAVIQFPGLIASENDWLESLVQWVVVDATSRGTILFFWRLGALVEAKHESDGRLPPQAQLKEPHSWSCRLQRMSRHSRLSHRRRQVPRSIW